MLVRIAIREDHDLIKKQSDLGLPCVFRTSWQATSVGNFRIPTVHLYHT